MSCAYHVIHVLHVTELFVTGCKLDHSEPVAWCMPCVSLHRLTATAFSCRPYYMLAGVTHQLKTATEHLTGKLDQSKSVAGFKHLASMLWHDAKDMLLWHDAKDMLQAAAMKRQCRSACRNWMLLCLQELTIIQWSNLVAQCMLCLLM